MSELAASRRDGTRYYMLDDSGSTIAARTSASPEESGFELYGRPEGFSTFVVPAEETSNSSTYTCCSNWLRSNAYRLTLLHEAIGKLGDLPSEHELHIDATTKDRAVQFLNLIGQDGQLPKLFPQDGEALVFTWDAGARKRMITIAGEEISGMDIDKKTRMRCDYDLSFEPQDRSVWFSKLYPAVAASVGTSDE